MVFCLKKYVIESGIKFSQGGSGQEHSGYCFTKQIIILWQYDNKWN